MEHKGYSLFELLITLAAIVIFVTLTLPKFNFVNKFILQNEVDKIYVTFSYLQKKAMASNRTQELYVDLFKNTYSYATVNNSFKEYKLPKVVEFGLIPGVLGPPYNPSKVIKSPITFKKKDNLYVINFYPDGNISSGSIFFVDKDKKYLFSLSCPVAPFSCIRRYKYENNKWVLLN